MSLGQLESLGLLSSYFVKFPLAFLIAREALPDTLIVWAGWTRGLTVRKGVRLSKSFIPVLDSGLLSAAFCIFPIQIRITGTIST